MVPYFSTSVEPVLTVGVDTSRLKVRRERKAPEGLKRLHLSCSPPSACSHKETERALEQEREGGGRLQQQQQQVETQLQTQCHTTTGAPPASHEVSSKPAVSVL